MSKTQTKEQQIKARGTQYLNDYYNLPQVLQHF